ncbi:MAG: metal ABC transporter solute-binding protein, Zn/Mn family [Planctomycetota bacterium]
MQILRISVVFLALVAVTNLVEPCQASDADRHQPYRITCTTGMVADIVRHVAGGRAQVESIIGEGVDPHLYRATRADIAKLMNADLIFYNGLYLEGKMGTALEKIAKTKIVRAVGEALPKNVLLAPEGHDAHPDPHVWMDVSLWKRCAADVVKTLKEFDRAGSDTYEENFATYATGLDELHEYAKTSMATIPAQQRLLVTAHDAFHYMGRTYGLEVRGIQGISTESEAGIADINVIVDVLVERNVGAIFVETSVSDKNVRALIEGARAQDHTVIIGGELFSDAMGKPGTYEGTYTGMIDHNITVIVEALGGRAPRRGLNGRLNR